MQDLELTAEEKEVLAGARGPGPAKAMELVAAVGRAMGAGRLVPISSAHVSGISYANIGPHGLSFIREILEGVDRLPVRTTINPCGMDLDAADSWGLPREFVEGQKAIIDALSAAGAEPLLTCTPYRAGAGIERGSVLAWAESSAVCWANSMLGARTNRVGGPEALASAIVGRTGEYGLLLDRNRLPTHVVDAVVYLKDPSDFGLLGLSIGAMAGSGVPFVRFAVDQPEPSESDLLYMAAAMAASGAVGLFYAEGAAPPPAGGGWEDRASKVRIDSLDRAKGMLGNSRGAPDLVAFGCPHCSVGEMKEISRLLNGRRVKATTWVMTSRKAAERAEAEGVLDNLRASGVQIVRDTCVVSAPLDRLGFTKVALDSAKAAFYCPSHCGVEVIHSSARECVEKAVRGR